MLHAILLGVLAFSAAQVSHDGTLAARRMNFEPAVLTPSKWRVSAAGEIPFDFDGDFDVDRHDYFAFTICLSFSGPDLTMPPACGVFDADADKDVDLADFAAFMGVFTGSTSRLLVEAGELVPIMPTVQTYYSGEPDGHDNNALHGLGRQAGFSQNDLWYDWTIIGQPPSTGMVIIANAAESVTAFRLQPDVREGEYVFRLTVTNLFTFEVGADEVSLSVIPCQNDLDCDDDLFCTAYDVCDPENLAAGIDGCLHYGSPCKCTPSGTPCNSSLGDRRVCDEADSSCLPCATDGECDDGVECTNDTCLNGLCIAVPVHGRCPQGLFCDKQFGCIPP